MDAVKEFNSELAGLYVCKLPISKAKMTEITKAAIRAIKFYKHVVQSVEKFIQKCKTEYKIPGLYVIDSIVRQSRHQFSPEKDVFAPRFAKNISVTFYYLFKCAQEDKSKVIRVLNLWQKNAIFKEDIIQPLFDLADPNHPIQKEIGSLILQKNAKPKSVPQIPQAPPPPPQQQHTPQTQLTPQQQLTPQHTLPSSSVLFSPSSNAPPSSVTSTLPTSGNQDISVTAHSNAVSSLDPMLIQQIQQILMKTADEGPVASAVAALGLQQQQNQPPPQFTSQNPPFEVVTSIPPPQIISSAPSVPPPVLPIQANSDPVVVPRLSHTGDYDGRALPFLPVDTSLPPPGYHVSSFLGVTQTVPPISQVPTNLPPPAGEFNYSQLQSEVATKLPSPREEGEHSDASEENKENQEEIHSSERRRRTRSRSKSTGRSKRKRRSGSRSRHRRSRSRGKRSRSRDRDRDRRDRDRDRSRRDKERYEREQRERENEREKERERKKKGLPPIKKDHLSVCSTTLWVGHLSKLVHQEEISDTFGEYGDIISIDLIPPRGCAFICMNRRQDSARALLKLKNHRLQNKAITLAWAPGKGVKGKDLKDYWEADHGCCYIPYSKLSQLSNVDLDAFEEGGVIDEDTVPDWLKGRYGHHSRPPIPVLPIVSAPHHLPPPVVNMGLPPPQNPPPEVPPVIHSHLDKDDRGDLHSVPPPPSLVSPFRMPSIPPPGSIQVLPPTLHAPMRMPPPIGIPPITMSNMVGQPLIGVSPSHVPPTLPAEPPVPIVSNVNAPELESMDIEMEDVEKAQPLLIEPVERHSPNNELLAMQEHHHLMVGMKNPGGPPIFDVHRPPEELEHPCFPNAMEGADSGSPDIIGKELRIQEGFSTLPMGGVAIPGPRFAPAHAPPRTVGILPHEHQNFDPRLPLGPHRAVFPHPSLLAPPQRHELLPEVVTRPQNIHAPRGIEIRPTPIGGILGPRIAFQEPPRRLAGPPGVINRFGLLPHPTAAPAHGPPPAGFTRFGIVRGTRPFVPLPNPLEEGLPGEWVEKRPARPPMAENPLEIPVEDPAVWERRNPVLQPPTPSISELINLPHNNEQAFPLEKKDERMSVTEILENKINESVPATSTVPPVVSEQNISDSVVDKDVDNEKHRKRSTERDWDRKRDKSGNRDHHDKRDWDRERNRDGRDWRRGRDYDREREFDHRDRGRDRDWVRGRDRWGGMSRERERDKGFSHSRTSERYSHEDDWRERPFDRHSRWGSERDRLPPREERRREREKIKNSEPFADDEMTWENWTSFSNSGSAVNSSVTSLPPAKDNAKANAHKRGTQALLPTPASNSLLSTPKGGASLDTSESSNIHFTPSVEDSTGKLVNQLSNPSESTPDESIIPSNNIDNNDNSFLEKGNQHSPALGGVNSVIPETNLDNKYTGAEKESGDCEQITKDADFSKECVPPLKAISETEDLNNAIEDNKENPNFSLKSNCHHINSHQLSVGKDHSCNEEETNCTGNNSKESNNDCYNAVHQKTEVILSQSESIEVPSTLPIPQAENHNIDLRCELIDPSDDDQMSHTHLSPSIPAQDNTNFECNKLYELQSSGSSNVTSTVSVASNSLSLEFGNVNDSPQHDPIVTKVSEIENLHRHSDEQLECNSIADHNDSLTTSLTDPCLKLSYVNESESLPHNLALPPTAASKLPLINTESEGCSPPANEQTQADVDTNKDSSS